MILTREINSNTPKDPIESSKQGEDIMNLLDLSPDDVVFYVGGYPDSFTVSSKEISTVILFIPLFLNSTCFINTSFSFASPQMPLSLNLPKYKGCIEFISFNDKVGSLYNFQNAEAINPQPPCKR